jgi:hypothetical protein
MNWKVGDKVESILDGESTGQFGTVIEVEEDGGPVVEPDHPMMKAMEITYKYDSNGQHEEPNFSIKKVEQQ